MNINGNTWKWVISKRKKTYKLVQLIARSNPFSSFPTTSFVKIFSFFSAFVFSFFLFFYWAKATKSFEVCGAWSKPLSNSFFDLSYSIFNSSKNSFHLMTTLCNVLSFMFFTKKPFSTDVGASSSLILFIE